MGSRAGGSLGGWCFLFIHASPKSAHPPAWVHDQSSGPPSSAVNTKNHEQPVNSLLCQFFQIEKPDFSCFWGFEFLKIAFYFSRIQPHMMLRSVCSWQCFELFLLQVKHRWLQIECSLSREKTRSKSSGWVSISVICMHIRSFFLVFSLVNVCWSRQN
jgi:hypothetical protein